MYLAKSTSNLAFIVINVVKVDNERKLFVCGSKTFILITKVRVAKSVYREVFETERSGV